MVSENGGVDVVVELGGVTETLIPMMRLRWKRTHFDGGFYQDRLQQLFQTPGGKPRWIDVPYEVNE